VLWVLREGRFFLPSFKFGDKAARQCYNAESPSEVREMRELQAEVANATYKRSSLGRLPAEVFNVILSFVAQPDQRPVGTS
jgi:hypothetical protein